MSTLIIVIHILASIFLISIVLLQAGKGSDLGSALGGGSSQSVFGTRRGNILTKTTAILATIFMATSLTITVLKSHPGSIIKESGEQDIAGETDTPAVLPKEKGELPSLKEVLPAGIGQPIPEPVKIEEPIKEEQRPQAQVKPVPTQVKLQPEAPKEKTPPVKRKEVKEPQTTRQVAPQGEKAQPKEEVKVKKEEAKEPPSSGQSPTEKPQPTTPEEGVQTIKEASQQEPSGQEPSSTKE